MISSTKKFPDSKELCRKLLCGAWLSPVLCVAGRGQFIVSRRIWWYLCGMALFLRKLVCRRTTWPGCSLFLAETSRSLVVTLLSRSLVATQSGGTSKTTVAGVIATSVLVCDSIFFCFATNFWFGKQWFDNSSPNAMNNCSPDRGWTIFPPSFRIHIAGAEFVTIARLRSSLFSIHHTSFSTLQQWWPGKNIRSIQINDPDRPTSESTCALSTYFRTRDSLASRSPTL